MQVDTSGLKTGNTNNADRADFNDDFIRVYLQYPGYQCPYLET